MPYFRKYVYNEAAFNIVKAITLLELRFLISNFYISFFIFKSVL
jgi:hypothetical protein